MNTKINHLAVWILVVVYFLIGWGWYAIFGEIWLNLHARTMTDIERTHNVSAYLLAFVASIIINYALAWLIKSRSCAGSHFSSSNTLRSPCSQLSRQIRGR